MLACASSKRSRHVPSRRTGAGDEQAGMRELDKRAQRSEVRRINELRAQMAFNRSEEAHVRATSGPGNLLMADRCPTFMFVDSRPWSSGNGEQVNRKSLSYTTARSQPTSTNRWNTRNWMRSLLAGSGRKLVKTAKLDPGF